MNVAKYLLALAITALGIALTLELGLRVFMPDAYRGYLIDAPGDQVKWRIGPYEPSQPATGYNDPVDRHKPDNTLRIVALGTSATEGWLTAKTVYQKYGRQTADNGISSYSRAMEFILDRMAMPGSADIEVINLGIAAYNVSDVIRMLKDSMQLEPDLLLIQIGGNETWTAERYHWASYINDNIPYLYTELGFEILGEIKGSWRTLSRGGSAFNPMALFGTRAQPIVAEPPGREEGLELRLKTFRAELERLAQYLRKQNIPFIFQIPAPNLADYAPFGSMAKPGTRPEQLDELNRRLIDALSDRSQAAKQKYLDILAIDDGIAEAHFQLGRLLLAENRPDEAREHFWKAVDRDLVLKRLPRMFRQAGLEFVQRQGFPYIDELLFFEAGTDSGVLGYNRLDDDVHPNMEAQFDLASGLTDMVLANGFLPADRYRYEATRRPAFADYTTHIAFDRTAAGNIAYLKAAHNYLTFGRFRQRLRWDPHPEALLQPILDNLAVANDYAPDDASRYLSVVLNLRLGREDDARKPIAALGCSESAEKARRVKAALLTTAQRALGFVGETFRSALDRVMIAEGCAP